MTDNKPERNQENNQSNFRPPAAQRKPPANTRANDFGFLGNLALNGIAKGLSEIVNAVNDLAERVDAARARADNYDAATDTVPAPAPAANLLPYITDKKPLVTTTPTPPTVREPLVDIFDEEAEGVIVVVIEVPGVSEENISFEIEGDILIFKTELDNTTASNSLNNFRYEKEILLPASVETIPASTSYQNGILELKLRKDEG